MCIRKLAPTTIQGSTPLLLPAPQWRPKPSKSVQPTTFPELSFLSLGALLRRWAFRRLHARLLSPCAPYQFPQTLRDSIIRSSTLGQVELHMNCSYADSKEVQRSEEDRALRLQEAEVIRELVLGHV